MSFYAFLSVLIGMALLPALGLVRGKEVSLYVIQLHGLISALLILLILQYRSYVLQRLQRETALQLERTRLEVSKEREIREENDKLLAMLAHELKTPLATTKSAALSWLRLE